MFCFFLVFPTFVVDDSFLSCDECLALEPGELLTGSLRLGSILKSTHGSSIR